MCVVEDYTVFVVEVVVVDVVFNGGGRVLVTPTERRWTALYLAPNNIMTPSRVTRVLRVTSVESVTPCTHDNVLYEDLPLDHTVLRCRT